MSKQQKQPLGKCPFCNTDTRAKIIEKNTLRRDKCVCDNDDCKEIVYTCRTPGCHDYAKGGEYYDDELCPSCLKQAPGAVVAVVGFVGTVLALFERSK